MPGSDARTNATWLVNTKSTYTTMQFATEILMKWLPIAAFTFGITGNMMSLLVTTRRNNRRLSTCVYMSGLAIVDTGVLLTIALHTILFGHGAGKGLETNLLLLSFIWYGTDTCAIISGLLLAAMSVDRAIAVTYPMKAASLCTASRATKIAVAIFVFESLIHTQTFFIYNLPDPPNGSIMVDYPKARWFEEFFHLYRLILGTLIPFSIIFFCNFVIIVGVRRSASERIRIESKPDRKRKEPNLTAMLLMTSFAYFICSWPKRVYATFVDYDMSDSYWSVRYWFQWWIFNELWLMNFATNFYVYFLGGGRKFRQDAKDVLECCRNLS